MLDSQITKLLAMKRFSWTSFENDKILPIQLETGKFSTAVASYLAHDFWKKSFLGTKLPISSEICIEFTKIQPLAMRCRSRRLGFSPKTA